MARTNVLKPSNANNRSLRVGSSGPWIWWRRFRMTEKEPPRRTAW